MESVSGYYDNSNDYEDRERHYPSFFQQLDYIPLVSTVTGVARVIFGVLEAVLGILTIPFELIRDAYEGKNHQYLLISGCANVGRGFVAGWPIVGNIALYLYDHSNLFNRPR